MIDAMRLAVFVLLLAVTSPIILLGSVLYLGHVTLVGRRRGISGTAYEPHQARFYLDALGLRPDPAATRIAPAVWCCWASGRDRAQGRVDSAWALLVQWSSLKKPLSQHPWVDPET